MATYILPPEVDKIFCSVQDSARYLVNATSVTWADNFISFDRIPFAAASIGRVHHAALAPSQSLSGGAGEDGQRVAVKYKKEFMDNWLRLLQAAASRDRTACAEVGISEEENEPFTKGNVQSESVLLATTPAATNSSSTMRGSRLLSATSRNSPPNGEVRDVADPWTLAKSLSHDRTTCTETFDDERDHMHLWRDY
ncbi:hypothetical protein M405DRAFT_878205 [Rhizopogon salebrosus TDB-379]|nr:hypothetical protein M405DRAFT_878205 [Rhizopogon salebrosus TDB-379]